MSVIYSQSDPTLNTPHVPLLYHTRFRLAEWNKAVSVNAEIVNMSRLVEIRQQGDIDPHIEERFSNLQRGPLPPLFS